MTPIHPFLNALRDNGRLLDIDVAFAGFVGRLTGDDPALSLLAAIVSNAFSRHNEIAVPLDRIATVDLLAEYLGRPAGELPVNNDSWPPGTGSRPEIFADGTAAADGTATVPAALLTLANGLVYLGRSFQNELFLRDDLLARTAPADAAETAANAPEIDFAAVTGLPLGDEQKAAVKAAMGSRFLVISGGPGTGKTTIVSVILALRNESPGEIVLCAPTGKAQMRMKQSLDAQAANLLVPDRRDELARIQSSTIHRLLAWDARSASFRFRRDNPLPYKLVIVDECSMIPLSLMTALLRAVRPDATVILLGDRRQLSSVEPGSVFGDFCDVLRDAARFPGCHAELVRSRRFREDGGIWQLKEAIDDGRAEDAWNVLKNADKDSEVRLVPIPGKGELDPLLRSACAGSWLANDGSSSDRYCDEDTLDAAWKRFERFRILTPFNGGGFGVERLNAHVQAMLKFNGAQRQAGEAFLVLATDYASGVFNGDVGLLWFADESGQPVSQSEADAMQNRRLLVFFPSGNGWRGIPRDALPDHAPAYAFTVHKSQGSDYDRVLMFLPPGTNGRNAILTREILYTGVTRAKTHVDLAADEEAFRQAVANRTERISDLPRLCAVRR